MKVIHTFMVNAIYKLFIEKTFFIPTSISILFGGPWSGGLEEENDDESRQERHYVAPEAIQHLPKKKIVLLKVFFSN